MNVVVVVMDSLLDRMRGEAEAVGRYACAGHHGRRWSIRSAEWACLFTVAGSGSPELYRRPGDPAEQRNLAGEHPHIAQQLKLDLRRWVAGLR
jgi:hypothetical protein